MSAPRKPVEILIAEIHVCLFCGCDDLHACSSEDGTPCHWVSRDPWICSAPACLQEHNERELQKLEVFRAAFKRAFP